MKRSRLNALVQLAHGIRTLSFAAHFNFDFFSEMFEGVDEYMKNAGLNRQPYLPSRQVKLGLVMIPQRELKCTGLTKYL